MSINNHMKKIYLYLGSQYFWVLNLPMVCKYLKEICNDFEIIFDFSTEAHLWIGRNGANQPIHLFEWIHHSLDFGDIPHSRATLISGNTKIKQSYENWHATLPVDYHKIKVECKNLWGTIVVENHLDISNVIKYDKELPHKDKIFTFFNGNARYHRLIAFMYMDDMGLLDKSYTTMLMEGPHNDIYRQYKREIDLTRFPMKLADSDPDIKSLVTHTTDVPQSFINAHINSYFDVVTETTMGNLGIFTNGSFEDQGTIKDDYSGPDWWQTEFFTEKLWRCIFYKRPFMLMGSPGQLQTLRELGFKTFENFWNEDYDKEPDFMKRIMKVCLQTHDMCKRSKQDIHNLFMSDSMKNIVEHNRKTLLDIYTNNEFDFVISRKPSSGFSEDSDWHLQYKDFDKLKLQQLANEKFKGSLSGITTKDCNIITPWL